MSSCQSLRDRAQALYSLFPFYDSLPSRRLTTLVWGKHSEWRCSLPSCPNAADAMDTGRQLWGERLETHCTAAVPGPTFPAAIVRIVVETVFINSSILETQFSKVFRHAAVFHPIAI